MPDLISLTPDPLDLLLEQQEAFSARVYRDSRGFLTVGFGTNLEVGISRRQALALLILAREEFDRALGALPWYAALDGVRRRVILDMAYNLGVTGVCGFHQMIAAIEARDFAAAKAHMLASDWARQVGHRAVILAEIMETGVFPTLMAA